MRVLSPSVLLLVAAGGLALAGSALAGCPGRSPGTGPKPAAVARAVHRTPLAQLNDGPCQPGQRYVQEPLREPMKIGAVDGRIETELVVAFRERCVPVWIPGDDQRPGRFEMQTMYLRTYGFPRDPDVAISETDVDDRENPKVAWSSPGPTFVLDTASRPGASDGTRLELRLYNRMPFETDPQACVTNVRCNTRGPNAGIDPVSGRCKQPIDPEDGGSPPRVPRQRVGGKVIEPPSCFHGVYSTNLHFHGLHVSPQAPQDNVGLELRPPPPRGVDTGALPHSAHGGQPLIAYGHYDFALDPLRYTQAPGTHWYRPHKHGATAMHVLNGQVGAFEVRGELDRRLEAYFKARGGGALADRLLFVQQIQERSPELGGTDPTAAVLVNGQGDPIVTMRRGEIQRWRFVGATVQASAALRIGFPERGGKPGPEVRQIAMDGVQLSPDNYACQPFLRRPDCTPPVDDSPFDEASAFDLSPGSRVDVLIKAPDTAGTHCLVLDITTRGAEAQQSREQHAARAALAQGTCGATRGLGPLLTLVVADEARPMTFPERADFPPMPPFLADLPPVTDRARQRAIHYEMVDQGPLGGTQLFINQSKYDGDCANETLTVDVPEQWTLWNNSLSIAHPFHIHQNPFQLLSQSDRGTYKYPVWRDVMPIPMAKLPATPNPPAAWPPSSNPQDANRPWGHAVIAHVARELTGGFVHHSHILGHADRGMMHNTQATCADGQWAKTGPVPPGARCDASGFCPGDCQLGTPVAATPACPAPPPQRGDWPSPFGVP